MKAKIIKDGKEFAVEFDNVFNLQLLLTVQHQLTDVKTNRQKVQKIIVSKNLTKSMTKDLVAMAKSLNIPIDLSGDWDEDVRNKSILDDVKKLDRLGIPSDKRDEYLAILELGEEFRTKMQAFLKKNAKHKVACGIYIGNKKV